MPSCTSRSWYTPCGLIAAAVLVGLAQTGGIPSEQAAAPPQNQSASQSGGSLTERYLAAMDPIARAHAKWFATHKEWDRVNFLDEGLNVSIDSQDSLLFEPPKDLLTRLACASDVAFVGTILELKSGPTDDGGFLFTDHVFRVERVVRANPGVRAARNEQVVVGRLGGEMIIEKRRRFASHSHFPPLRVGLRYLVFAKYLSDPSSFVVADRDAVSHVSELGVALLDRHKTDHGRGTRGDDPELVYRIIANAKCGPGGRGR